MKNYKTQMKQVIFMTLLALLSWSCIHENFDEPPVAKNYDFEANTTIAELKAMYDADKDTNQIETDVVIKATVISSDETGNFYKKLVLQDSTGGIEFQIDQYDLYLEYPVGAEVLVKCKGLYIGDYAGVIQMGSSVLTSGGFTNIVRMPPVMLPDVFFLTGNYVTPVPDTLAISQLSDDNINTLIAIKNVQFADGQAGNATYADAVGQTTQNRTVVEYKTNNTILLRNSGFASFVADTLPEGSGVLVAVYGVFNADQQLFIRDTKDVQFDQPRYTGTSGGGGEEQGTGTKDDPYNVLKAINNQGSTVWVEGYIVGCINDISLSTATFTSPFSATTNILLADDPEETDINNCVPVQLPFGDIRTALNLADNAGNHKKQVIVKGELTAYFGVPGIKNVNGYWMDGDGIDPDYVPEGQIYSQTFSGNIDAFTAFNVAGSAVWEYQTYDGGCAVANAYNQGANEDWLVSPAINTAGYATVTIQVRQAMNYIKTNGWGDCQVLVSNDYDGTSSPDQQGTWNLIEFNTKPAGSDWNFVDSENVDITSYSGGNIYVALKYLSTATEAVTWEVSTVSVNGSN
ncbi:DUF5689 domain-containing protein [Saccharicrinis sp. FJH62]|uniref:DUF5689 domain-containing protein n=1 Tax=Saccharicrinis sp. FJH62 TaxID=3344657 RepID=UPI0035D49FCB